MNQRLLKYRWFFSILLTLAFSLSQFASFAAAQSTQESASEIFQPKNFSGSNVSSYQGTKGNVCQFIADEVEDDIDESSSVEIEKTLSEASFNLPDLFSRLSFALKSKLHNHPFLESKPFRALPVFLEIQTFRI